MKCQNEEYRIILKNNVSAIVRSWYNLEEYISSRKTA